MTTPGSTATLPALSREYVRVDVEAVELDEAVVRTLPVAFAFLQDSTARPVELDWRPGSWEPEGTTARCLVGPGGAITLGAGTWNVWVRIDGVTERPVRPAGRLKVT